jgi:hypothetical protein
MKTFVCVGLEGKQPTQTAAVTRAKTGTEARRLINAALRSAKLPKLLRTDKVEELKAGAMILSDGDC